MLRIYLLLLFISFLFQSWLLFLIFHLMILIYFLFQSSDKSGGGNDHFENYGDPY